MKIVSFFRACWQRRWFRTLVWVGVFILTLGVLVHQWANWAGARAWAQAAQSMTAEGETLNYRAVIDAPVPESENFGALPVFKNICLQTEDAEGLAADEVRKRLDRLRIPPGKDGSPADRPRTSTAAVLGQPVNLAAWAEWLRKEGTLKVPDTGNAAQDILEAMAEHDAVIKEMAAGLDRPSAQWTPAWKTRELPGFTYSLPVPQYSTLQGLGNYLQLRATAAAQSGDAVKAHESLLILARISQATLREPFLIGSLVAMSQIAMLHQGVWEVCNARLGTPANFDRLRVEIAKLQPTPALLMSLRAETAMSSSTILWLRNQRDLATLNALADGLNADRSAVGMFFLLPRGWFDANAAEIVSMSLKHLILPLRDKGLAASVDQQEVMDAELLKAKGEHLWNLDKIMAFLTLPAMGKIVQRAAYTESLVLQMQAACALESSYLTSQHYPDSLADMVLPVDPLSQQPLSYRKEGKGGYRLWTPGFDLKDDDGMRGLKPGNPEGTKFNDAAYKGDWVWNYRGR